MPDLYEEKVKPFIQKQCLLFLEWQWPLNAPGHRQAFLSFTYPSFNRAVYGLLYLRHHYQPGVAYTLNMNAKVSPDGNDSSVEVVLTYPTLLD
jgi:hypothetical protein